jgi:hypothetical protein
MQISKLNHVHSMLNRLLDSTPSILCEIITLNPVDRIEQVDNKAILYSTFDMDSRLSYDPSFIGSFVDEVDKYVIFTYTNKPLNLMSMNKKDEELSFELEDVRTTTDVSMTKGEIRFTLVMLSPNMDVFKYSGIFNSKSITIHPMIYHIDGGENQEYSLYFYIEDVQKTRKRKLEKIIKKRNAINQ